MGLFKMKIARKCFKHTPVKLDYDDLDAVTGKTGRQYVTPDGRRYPSITTVLSVLSKDGIREWRARVGEEEANRVMRHAATRGTAMHTIAERYLNNEEHYFAPQEMPHVKGMFGTIQTIIDANIDEVVLQECPLYSNHLGVAGRVDLVAKFNGKHSIVDFKTSSRVKTRDHIQSYFMQAAAYAIMFEERTGIPVPQLVILMAVENSTEPLVFVEKRDTWVPGLIDTINEYNKSKLFGHA